MSADSKIAEAAIDVALVGRLLATQCPQWAELPLEPFDSAGTDNAIFRLGEDMAVRLPRVARAVEQVDKEQRWLPRLAPFVPLAIPVPLAKGVPGEGYPWPWSVYPWIKGEVATVERLTDQRQAAIALAEFVAALHSIDTAGGPAAGAHNFFRGVPLAMRDSLVRRAMTELRDTVDISAVTAAWEADLHVPKWAGPPVWVHGDIHAGNLLVRMGRLHAVIDFGGLGVGDPACDLIVAWNLLSADAREIFRARLQVDDACWARGRGWALSIGLIALPYYRGTNSVITASAEHTIDEVLADHRRAT